MQKTVMDGHHSYMRPIVNFLKANMKIDTGKIENIVQQKNAK